MNLDKVKKPLLVGAAVATIGIGSAGFVHGVSAATDTSSSSASTSANNSSSDSDNPMSSLIDKLAAKFNLNKDEIQAVFDADRNEHEAEMKADQQERLAQAVTDGMLTQDQADHITAALEEIDTLRGNSSPENESDETRDAVRAKMDALRDWAKENNIDHQYIMGGHGGPGGPGGPRANDTGDSSSDSSGSDS